MSEQVTYIYMMDHRAPGQGSSSDRGASGQERTFQDPTTVALIQRQAALDPNAIIHVVAPDGLVGTSIDLPNVQVHSINADDASFYNVYDAKISQLAAEGRANGSVIGVAPHYDAIVHASAVNAQTVASATQFGGAHAITGDNASAASQALAQSIANNAIKPATNDTDITLRTNKGKEFSVTSQSNTTLNKHESSFDSIVLVEVAAQYDAIGLAMREKGVELTPAYNGVSIAGDGTAGSGPGYSQEVGAYSRWLNGQSQAGDDAILSRISAVMPLESVPQEVANMVGNSGMLDGWAGALDAHAQQNLGYQKAAATAQAPQTTQDSPEVDAQTQAPQNTTGTTASNAPETTSSPDSSASTTTSTDADNHERAGGIGDMLGGMMGNMGPMAMFFGLIMMVVTMFNKDDESVATQPDAGANASTTASSVTPNTAASIAPAIAGQETATVLPNVDPAIMANLASVSHQESALPETLTPDATPINAMSLRNASPLMQ